MARKFVYNGTVYTSLKDIAKVIGVNRIRPKNFRKYSITELAVTVEAEPITNTGVITEQTTTEPFPFHDPTNRVELFGTNGENFHHRAFVTTVECSDFIIKYLVSYGGVVAMVTVDKLDDATPEEITAGKTATVYGTYSTQTLEHIKAFLQQEDFVAEDCAQIRNDYMK